MKLLIISFAACLAYASVTSAFITPQPSASKLSAASSRAHLSLSRPTSLFSSAPSDTGGDDYSVPSGSVVDELESCKSDLVRLCGQSEEASLEGVQDLVSELEMLGEQAGIGQASSNSGLLSGEW